MEKNKKMKHFEQKLFSYKVQAINQNATKLGLKKKLFSYSGPTDPIFWCPL